MNLEQAFKYLKLDIILAKGPELIIHEISEPFSFSLATNDSDLIGKELSELFLDFDMPLEGQAKILTLTTGVSVEVRVAKIPDNYFIIFFQRIGVSSIYKDEKEDSASLLQAVINTAADGIITINKFGIVESMNSAAAKLFGYLPEEVLGKNIKMLMPEPHHSNHDSYMHNYQNTGVKKIIGIGREVMARRNDGSTFPIHLSISEVKLNSKTIYTGILHDLTVQKAAEEKVRRYAKELERSNSELQDFAYVSSHDLQEPLRKIRAFGDRLKREADQMTEKGLDYLERMINAAERMQHLINDLLSFSRVSTHAKPFSQIDLSKIINDVLIDLEYTIENSKASFELGNLPEIEAEPTQMRQLFQNLISNALKFHKEKQLPIIKIYSQVMPRKANSNFSVTGENLVKIFVEDNGIGFDEQYKDKIFQIFQRLEGRKYEGSGIGLAICKRIVSRHGGDIEARSLIDVGTTFVITLPIKQSNSSTAES